MTLTPRFRIGLTLLALSLLSSCNLFSVIDSPGGDIQLLSAARACLNQLDFTCAREKYGQMSTTYADTVNSELAISIVNQYGATMGNFASAFGNGKSIAAGVGITRLASSMQSQASVTARMDIFDNAYAKANAVTNSDLKNFTKFIVATALLGELLAEAGSSPGSFRDVDLVSSPSACIAAGIGGCAGSASCDPSALTHANLLETGATINVDLDHASATSTAIRNSGNPSLQAIKAAIATIQASVSNLGGSGGLGSTLGGFGQVITAVALNASPDPNRCFRLALLNQRIGQSE